MDSCLGWEQERFKPWISKVWTRFKKLGFRIHEMRERRKRREEEREMIQENEGNRV